MAENITNERIWEKLEIMDERLHFVSDQQKAFSKQQDKTFQKIEDVEERLTSVEHKLISHQITWNTGIIASVIAASSVTTLILIRVLSVFGVKLASGELPIV